MKEIVDRKKNSKKISFSFEASEVMNANPFFINLTAKITGRDMELFIL